LPKRSVVRRNLECACRSARKSVAAAKTCWKEKGSRRGYSLEPPRATDKAARRMGVARVRLRTTITGSLYHSVLFNGTQSSAENNIVPYEPLERSCAEYS
jgi:hypothetical protein